MYTMLDIAYEDMLLVEKPSVTHTNTSVHGRVIINEI